VAIALLALGLVACGNGEGPSSVAAQAVAPAKPAPQAPPPSAAPAPAPSAAPAPAPSAAPTPARNPLLDEALRYDPADPLSNLETADVLDRGAARGGGARKLVVPARGCALVEEPRRVWPKQGIAALAGVADGFVIAGYTRGGGGEQVFVVHITASGKLEPVATVPLDVPHPGERVAPPGLAGDGMRGVVIAYVDGAGTLFSQVLRVGAAHGGGAASSLATGVDTRFTPAVDFSKRGALIAYTLGTTPMRSMLVRLGPKGDVLATHDVTPPAMGAAAPTFLRGNELALITADPRNGLSPIARTPLDLEGKPGTAEVAAPVGMMSQPPQLAAAQADFGAYVTYAGLGSAATSAIGLVKIAPKAASPEAFIKGTAYGALHSAALGLRGAIVIAADAPLTAGKDPKHELQIALLDAKGRGPTLRLNAPSGDATHVALASDEDDRVGVSFSAPDGVYFATLRCGH
jgi:hypothetical protein